MEKILIVVERFWPEDFLVNDFATFWSEELSCRNGENVEVDVLTQIPSYPLDKIFDGYENRAMDETHGKIRIHRVSTVLGYNTSVKRKIWNYLHFALATTWWAMRHGRKYDRVFIYHTAALLMASSALPLRWIWRKPITIWTQDLWPDAVYAYGFKPKWWKAAILNTFVRRIYGACLRICVSCPSYVSRIKELTGRTAEFIPQWDPDTSLSSLPPLSTRSTPLHGQSSTSNLIFMFAGNLGVPQNLENDIAGFLQAKIPNAEFWIVGGGVRLDELKAKFGHEPSVKFCGRQPRADMPKWFAQAHVLIISLTKEYRLTFPGKFQSYIKTGRPLLGIIEGDVRAFIENERLGWTASPDDLAAIAAAFQSAAEGIRTGLAATCGANAQSLSTRLFCRETCIQQLLG